MHPKFLCEEVQGNNRLFAKPYHRWKKDLKVCPMEIKDEGLTTSASPHAHYITPSKGRPPDDSSRQPA